MSAYDDPFARETMDTLSRYFREIPEMGVDNADAEQSNTVVTAWGYGWSPTLHRVATLWTLDLGVMARHPHCQVRHAVQRLMDRDAEVVGELLQPYVRLHSGIMIRNGDGILQAMAERQWRRVRAAGAMGRGRPLAMPSVSAPSGDDLLRMEVEHVMIDRTVVDLVRAVSADAREAATAILSLLCEAHQGERPDDDDMLWMGDHSMTMDDADGTSRIRIEMDVGGEDSTATFDGRDLRLDDVLPESVLSAMEGRPLCDIVETGTALDARLVATCDVRDGGTTIRLAPDDVSLATLRDDLH